MSSYLPTGESVFSYDAALPIVPRLKDTLGNLVGLGKCYPRGSIPSALILLNLSRMCYLWDVFRDNIVREIPKDCYFFTKPPEVGMWSAMFDYCFRKGIETYRGRFVWNGVYELSDEGLCARALISAKTDSFFSCWQNAQVIVSPNPELIIPLRQSFQQFLNDPYSYSQAVSSQDEQVCC